MTETTEEKPGIDPAQKSELEGMAADFIPKSEPIAGDGESPGVDLDSGKICTGVVAVVAGFAAAKRGPHWGLSSEESELLGNAAGPLLDKYMPDLSGEMGPEMVFISALAMIVVPRIMIDLQPAANDEDGGQDGDSAASQFAE